MKSLIIDISAAPFHHYVRRYGKFDGILFGCWYRIARPAMVAIMWLMFGLYVYHSLVMVGGTAAQIADLLVYVAVVAHMAAALIAWMAVCRFHDWIRMHDGDGAASVQPVGNRRWLAPADEREVKVMHDDDGRIIGILPWRAGAGEPAPAASAPPVGAPAPAPAIAAAQVAAA